MKKCISVLCIFVLLIAFGACQNRKENKDPTETGAGGTALRLVDGAGTERLVLAGEKSGELYTAGTNQLTVYIDGEEAAPSELENGMLLTLDPEYDLLETWPAQIVGDTLRAQSNPGGTEDHGDLCGLYLQVLEDLWKDDSGLNGDITYISVYLDEAPGDLTDGEKAAVAWIFSGRHNAEGLQLGFEGLKENGYVNAEELYWADGVLFSIKQSEYGTSTEKKITFTAEKWRSGTGAIFYTDCTAKRGKGVKWEAYKTGGFAIA